MLDSYSNENGINEVASAPGACDFLTSYDELEGVVVAVVAYWVATIRVAARSLRIAIEGHIALFVDVVVTVARTIWLSVAAKEVGRLSVRPCHFLDVVSFVLSGHYFLHR